MTIEEKIKACMGKYPDRDDRHISQTVHGATLAMVRAVRAGEPMPEADKSAERPQPSSVGVITLDAVKARYDIAAAIRREIGKLNSGALILESEMRLRAAGKDAARFRRAVENTDEFKANRIRLQLGSEGGEAAWYWGDNSTISAALRVRDSI